MEERLISHSEAETKTIARSVIEDNIGRYRPLVIGLKGNLGAGKTVFVKGAASFLGIPESRVSSPTFVIMNVYRGEYKSAPVVLQHLDLYRLNSSYDLYSFGWEEIIRTGDISIVEWADRFMEYLPEDTIWVNIEHIDETRRGITISIPGSSIG